MKLLVFSDTHASLHFMRYAIDKLQPNQVIHLGDYYEDAKAVMEDYPNIVLHQVPGNCDKYRMTELAAETLCYNICGVRFYMTHGHLHGVKYGFYHLRESAHKCNAQIALYGHTHSRLCEQEDDGLWIMNPGAAGSCGEIIIENEKIVSCKLWMEGDF